MLDIIIILLVLAQAFWWAEKGFVRGVFSLVGFWLGMLIGAWLAPYIIGFVGDEPLTQILLALFVILAAALIGESIGRTIGMHLGGITEKLNLEKIDSVLGAAFSVGMTLIITWLFASIISGVPLQGLNRQIRESAIIQTMNEALPPAPDVLSKLASIIDQSGYPQVFVGPEPRPVEPVEPPSSAEVAAAIKAAGRSTVRIEGAGCGGVLTGSGFVASNGLIVTNAHVIAGIGRPFVVDVNGKHSATPVVFDPDLDIAILKVGGLAGQPLSLSGSSQPRGTAATVLGYPNGGPLEGDAAGLLRQLEARGRNIYGEKIVTRDIYELQTTIDQGNSGGPVVLSDGTVIGVVFARSVGSDNIGYAVTSVEVAPLLQQAKASGQAVATGACAT